MDKNLDGLLDAEELLAGTPDWKQPLCKHLLPAFDFSGDNKLSLHEYRLTPHANMLLYFQG